jgi:hypothetical protein
MNDAERDAFHRVAVLLDAISLNMAALLEAQRLLQKAIAELEKAHDEALNGGS